MDPVRELIRKIYWSEERLRATCQSDQVVYSARRVKAAVAILDEIRGFSAALSRTSPISLFGAGEQIRFAADRLPYPKAVHAQDLHEIADRFCAGDRIAADVIWLRTLVRTMAPHPYEGPENMAASLLRLAIASVSRPAIVHRTARPVRPRMRSLPSPA
jgi:hypothetical protein